MSFFLVREIKSKTGMLHFRRWRLIATPWFSVFIHGIYKEDKDEHLHNHPWNYFSMGLKGSYVEEVQNQFYFDTCNNTKFNLVKPFKMVKRNKSIYHKIFALKTPSVYTLFIIGKRLNDDWGYNVNGEHIDHETYRKMKNEGKFKTT